MRRLRCIRGARAGKGYGRAQAVNLVDHLLVVIRCIHVAGGIEGHLRDASPTRVSGNRRDGLRRRQRRCQAQTSSAPGADDSITSGLTSDVTLDSLSLSLSAIAQHKHTRKAASLWG